MDSDHSAAGKEPAKQGKGFTRKGSGKCFALQKEIDQQTKSWEAFNTPRLQLQKSDLEKKKRRTGLFTQRTDSAPGKTD